LLRRTSSHPRHPSHFTPLPSSIILKISIRSRRHLIHRHHSTSPYTGSIDCVHSIIQQVYSATTNLIIRSKIRRASLLSIHLPSSMILKISIRSPYHSISRHHYTRQYPSLTSIVRDIIRERRSGATNFIPPSTSPSLHSIARRQYRSNLNRISIACDPTMSIAWRLSVANVDCSVDDS
jgi:hypothetical protein